MLDVNMKARASTLGIVAMSALAFLDCGSTRRFTPTPSQVVLATDPAGLEVTRCGGRFVAIATIDGVGPFRLVLDTGSSASIFSSGLAARASLPLAPVDAIVGTADGARRIDRAVHVRSLKMGAFEIADFDALVYPSTANLGVDAGAYDGILGMSSFTSVAITFDFPRGRVSVSSRTLAEDPFTSTLDVSMGVPVVWASWDDFTVPAVLDTGYTGELALPRGGAWSFATAPGRRAALGRLDGSVSIGTMVLEQPSVRLTEEPALVGTEALRNTVLTLDARTRLARFDGPRLVVARPKLGIGATFRQTDASWEIRSVFDDTPASRVGLRTGDRVLSIDGMPVRTFACGKWEERLGSPQPVRLQIERDGDPFGVEIVPTSLVD